MAKKRVRKKDDFFIDDSEENLAREINRYEKNWANIDGMIVKPDSSIEHTDINRFKFIIFMLMLGLIVLIFLGMSEFQKMMNGTSSFVRLTICIIVSFIDIYWMYLIVMVLYYSNNNALIESYIKIISKNKILPRIKEVFFYQDAYTDEEYITIEMNKRLQLGVTLFISLATYIKFIKSIKNDCDSFFADELKFYSDHKIVENKVHEIETDLLTKIFKEQYTRFREKKIYFNKLWMEHRYDYMS